MIHITPISAFKDNYIWCIYCDESHNALVVDPGDAEPVLHFLKQHQLKLERVLITHHHPDHTGGLDRLIEATSSTSHDLTIHGPKNARIPQLTHQHNHHDVIEIPWLHRQFEIMHTPGHTLDHICFYSAAPAPWLFCGDTLFSGGCGRLFEGTSLQMHASLSALARCPDETLVFCTHEYTLANLRFALAVEPQNSDLNHHLKKVEQLRAAQQPSLPSSIGLEKRINPFLRANQTQVIQAAIAFAEKPLFNEVEVFASIRSWKDHF